MIQMMTVKTETATGMVKTENRVCYGADDVAEQREHFRRTAPAGSTRTITVKPYNR